MRMAALLTYLPLELSCTEWTDRFRGEGWRCYKLVWVVVGRRPQRWPKLPAPLQPPTVAPSPLILATSGSSAPAKVIGSLERAGGILFLWPSSQEVLGLSPASYVVSVL